MFADRFLGGNAFGARIRPARQDGGARDLGAGGVWYTVVGVVPVVRGVLARAAVQVAVRASIGLTFAGDSMGSLEA